MADLRERMEKNRRNFARITVNIPAALSLIQVDSYHSGSIANLSMGGCFFPAEDELPLGAQCDIEITVGEGIETESFTLQGIVVRSDALGVGIKFIAGVEKIPIIMKKVAAQSWNRD